MRRESEESMKSEDGLPEKRLFCRKIEHVETKKGVSNRFSWRNLFFPFVP